MHHSRLLPGLVVIFLLLLLSVCDNSSTSVSIEGNAEVIIAVSTSLKAAIVGIGTINYTGNPAVSQNITGLGTVTRKE